MMDNNKKLFKIDWWIHVILGGIVLLVQYKVLFLLTLAGISLLISVYVNTTYTLADDKLICYCYFYSQEIKYYNINDTRLCEHISISPVLSTKRITIGQ
ncbi:MAG: PH domain-containing protein [Culicoidibacterales bacterium]